MESPRPQPLAPAPAGPPEAQQPLACLAEAARNKPWRPRGAHEADDVLLEAEEGGRCSRVPLRSLGRTSQPPPAQLLFSNRSSQPVRMMWLNCDGAEVPYTTLQPGETKLYRTFVHHAWQARELASERRCCIDGAQAVYAQPPASGEPRSPQPTVITDAPALRWSPAAHWAFPRRFRAQARALLLSWQRLAGGSCDIEAAPTTSSGSRDVEMADAGAPAADLGSLPCDLVRLIIERMAPADLWQDSATAHPDIQPVRLHSAAAFDKLVRRGVRAAGGRLPPSSRRAGLAADEVLPRPPAC